MQPNVPAWLRPDDSQYARLKRAGYRAAKRLGDRLSTAVSPGEEINDMFPTRQQRRLRRNGKRSRRQRTVFYRPTSPPTSQRNRTGKQNTA